MDDAVTLASNAPQVDWLVNQLNVLDSANPIYRVALSALIIGTSVTLILFSRWYANRKIRRLRETDTSTLQPLKIQRQELLSAEDVIKYQETLFRLAEYVAIAFLALGVLAGVMMLSAFTQSIAIVVLNIIFSGINFVWSGFIGYLPDLLTIIVIVLAVRFLLSVTNSVFEGIANRRIRLPNFYPEWADTSFTLLKILVYALTIVVIFPYLPGSGSPAFQGVSIFVGVLLSLGSTSAVANIVAGIVLTYTRAFEIGEQVQISDARGHVLERSLFVTRLQTLKNVVVSIPNAMVLNNHIINYSRNMGRQGLVVHTTVTIGYDVPWQKVHTLLLEAASKTEGLEALPQPFVLQTSLDDFYVSYELNGWSRKPEELPAIYSDLHANILDAFHAGEVEITSPHFRANRDGSDSTIPGNTID